VVKLNKFHQRFAMGVIKQQYLHDVYDNTFTGDNCK